MDDLFSARTQMAMSLGFHIVFAVVGMAMPALMVASELLYRRTQNEIYRQLRIRWAKGTAILFAVGAVSGTVLSFELGLLWPRFMEVAGPLVGFAFGLEGYAFFLEAIALGIFLYGENKISKNMHLLSGVVVALSGLASGIFVVSVNGFMNAPAGFIEKAGELIPNDPIAAFFNDAFFTEALHMALAAYVTVAFMVLGIHALLLLRTPSSAFHQAALKIALGFAIVCVPLQILSGDLSAKFIAKNQPMKLAAAEGHYKSERGAGVAIFGIPDEENEVLRYGVHVPYALSIMAFGDPHAEVKGLSDFEKTERPPVTVVYVAFRIMVGLGTLMLLLAGWGLVVWLKDKGRFFKQENLSLQKRFLKASVLLTPAGVIALQAGWTVTEVGRQPYVIKGILRTSDAVTPMPGLLVPCILSFVLYLGLGAVVIVLMRRHVFREPMATPQKGGSQ